jgi:hypothetical protein
VEACCAELVDQLGGLTYKRWARGVAFPEPKALEGADLTGQVLEEEEEAIRIEAPPVPAGLGGASVRPQTATMILPRSESQEGAPPAPRRVWPWVALAGFVVLCLVGMVGLTMVFAAVLSALWMA